MVSAPGAAMGCTTAPPIASPSAASIDARRRRRRRSRMPRPRRTPPTSVLCTMSPEPAFSATGKPMPLGHLGRLVGRRHVGGGHDGDAVVAEQVDRPRRGRARRRRAARRARSSTSDARRRARRCPRGRERALRAAPPGRVVDDPRQRVGGRLGEGERRDRSRPAGATARGCPAWRGSWRARACPSGCRGRLADGASDVVGARHERRDEDDEDRVDVGVGQHRAQRPLVVGGRRPTRRGRPGCAPPAAGGRNDRSARLGARPRARAPRGPAPSHASAARMPGPPALPTIADPAARAAAAGGRAPGPTSNSCSSVSTRITPAWRNSASTATSGLASAAVCDDAARVPASDARSSPRRSACVRETRRAMRLNLRGLPNDSR